MIFQRIILKYYPRASSWFLFLSVLCLFIGYIGAFITPADIIQKNVFRFFYLHVPAAWLSLSLYGAQGLLCGIYVVWKSPLSFHLARAISYIGILFTIICIISGSLWGKHTWGTYWSWDVRLTTMAILLFMQLSGVAILKAFPNNQAGRSIFSAISLIGCLNIPVIKWSVTLWSSLHQTDTIRLLSKSTMPFSMSWPLIPCTLGWGLLATYGIGFNLKRFIKQQKDARKQWI